MYRADTSILDFILCTGNRRYWVVKVKQTEQRKRWNFSQDEKDQIWAEAKKYYEEGEKLYLEGDMIEAAEGAQMKAMEEDERKGLVEEYLNTLLPTGWEKMDLYPSYVIRKMKETIDEKYGQSKRKI